MKNILLTLLFVAHPLIAAPPVPAPPVESEFKADPRIKINREQANKEGVSIIELSKRVQKYLEERDQFTLDELKSLEIPTFDGKTVKLSQVASIEVTFRKVPPKTSEEQAGTGQPAIRSVSNLEGGDKPQSESEGRSR